MKQTGRKFIHRYQWITGTNVTLLPTVVAPKIVKLTPRLFVTLCFQKVTVKICDGGNQGRNEVRWRPGQDASLAPPYSNLRSFGSECTVLKNVRVTLLGFVGNPQSFGPPQWFSASIVIRRPGNCASLPLRYTPADWTIMLRVKSYRCLR